MRLRSKGKMKMLRVKSRCHVGRTYLHILSDLFLLISQLAKGINDETCDATTVKHSQLLQGQQFRSIAAASRSSLRLKHHSFPYPDWVIQNLVLVDISEHAPYPVWWPEGWRWRRRRRWCQRPHGRAHTHLPRGPRSHLLCLHQRVPQHTCGTGSTKWQEAKGCVMIQKAA